MQARRPPAARHALVTLITPTLFALAVAAAVAVIWTAPEAALDGVARAVDWLRARDVSAGSADRAIATTVLVALAALGYVVAWARATSLRRPLRVADGEARIAVDDLANWIRDAVCERRDVRDAVVRVENLRRRGVRVSLLLHVTPDARLDEAVAASSEVVQHLVREQAGLRLARTPAVEVRYEELILNARRPSPESRDSHAA